MFINNAKHLDQIEKEKNTESSEKYQQTDISTKSDWLGQMKKDEIRKGKCDSCPNCMVAYFCLKHANILIMY